MIHTIQKTHRLWHVRLCDDDCTKRTEKIDQSRILARWLESESRYAGRRVDAFDIERVLDSDGQAMERTDQSARALKMVV